MIAGRHPDNAFLAALPAAARAKFERLRDQQVALSAAFSEASNRLRHAKDELAMLTSRLAETERRHVLDPMFHPRGPGVDRYEPPGEQRDKAIAAQKEKLVAPLREGAASAKAEVERLEAHMARLKSRVSAVPSRCLQWGTTLDLMRPITLFDGKVSVPKGPATEAVTGLRQRLVELRAERDEVQRAPYPAVFAKNIVRQWVEAQARQGAIARPARSSSGPSQEQLVAARRAGAAEARRQIRAELATAATQQPPLAPMQALLKAAKQQDPDDFWDRIPQKTRAQ